MSKVIVRIKMIKNFLIINCIGKDDKLALRINKDFFFHKLKNKDNNDKLVLEILKFLKTHKVFLDNKFTVIVNQGPGSFSGVRLSIAIAKGLMISKNIKLYGFNSADLKKFDQKNIEIMLNKHLIEKNLIKPIYLS